MTREDIRRSRFLSLVLRHRPEAAGLVLDAEGWAEVSALLRGATQRGVDLSPGDVVRVVQDNDKQRFELSPDGARIRARQGHSVPVDLGLAPRIPPDVLFHGTVARVLPAIRREGLRPMQRHHVHLSPDRETAERR
ncbi:MAG: RNA 2'-phosphotransferase [Bacteroidota bacterium]